VRHPAVASLIAALALLAGACSDDDSGSASAQVCDARAAVDDSLGNVADDVAAGNLGDARDDLDEAEKDLDNLRAAVNDLAEGEREDLAPEVDQLESDIADLTDADSLDALGTQVDSVMSQAGSIIDQIASSLDC
jgi:hypothetical protein